MQTINNIAVAVDFSEYSTAAVQFAARLARDVGAAVRLVNVINQRDVDRLKKVADQVPAFDLKTYLEQMRQDREERFQQLVQSAGIEIPGLKTSIRIGVPHQELLAVIAAKRPDLLVMAVKGRTNLVDTIVGGCARRMFRRCPIPLLSIRGDGTPS
jgi:nucleotide-binding universal stress UspA family protein